MLTSADWSGKKDSSHVRIAKTYNLEEPGNAKLGSINNSCQLTDINFGTAFVYESITS